MDGQVFLSKIVDYQQFPSEQVFKILPKNEVSRLRSGCGCHFANNVQKGKWYSGRSHSSHALDATLGLHGIPIGQA